MENKKASSDFFKNAFVFLFLLFLPTQLGKHFFLPFSYISGLRIDHLAPTLYFTDLLCFGLIASHFSLFNRFLKQRFVWISALALLIHSLVFAQVVEVALYRELKILEVFFIFFLFKERRPSTSLVLTALGIGISFEAVLSVFQFINKHSLQGVFYFFGERAINLSLPDIAKASLDGIELLRPYGTFSHPNSMAGFYLLVYTFVLTLKKTSQYKIVMNAILTLATLLIFLSFSKVAISLFLVINGVYLIRKGDFSCKLCFFSRALVLLVLSFVFISAGTDPLSFTKRMFFFQSALDVAKNHLLFGVGLGNYLVSQKAVSSLLILTPQPVHNIFVLLFLELGLVMFSTLVFFSWKRARQRMGSFPFLLCLIVVVATGMVDHYWITLQQNLLLLPVIFGLLESRKLV